MSGTQWLVIGLFVALVVLWVLAEIDHHRHFAERMDGTPIGYNEFDRMLSDFDRQRQGRYAVSDDHERIRDEIRANKPRPWLAVAAGLLVIVAITGAMLALPAWNTIAPPQPQNTIFITPENQTQMLTGGLVAALVMGGIIGLWFRAQGHPPHMPIIYGIGLYGLARLMVALPPGEGWVLIFGQAALSVALVFAGAMVPATIISMLGGN